MADRCLLYYVTDRAQFLGDESARRRALLAKIKEAATAGVDYIQLREKDLSAKALEVLSKDAISAIHEALSLRTETRELRAESATRLLINSRTDVALAAGANGVHLRAEDISPAEVRELWGKCGGDAARLQAPVIAMSCHDPANAMTAAKAGADFAVFAPVFGKRGMAGAKPAGLTALRKACEAAIPVFALGGVTKENAVSCLEAGAAGIAGIRLFQENKIEDLVRALGFRRPTG
jgi:thiamine-phosphate pyrophosphorylase